jgi:hypothetical protein
MAGLFTRETNQIAQQTSLECRHSKVGGKYEYDLDGPFSEVCPTGTYGAAAASYLTRV